MSNYGYVSHLRMDNSDSTVCGEPWQGWQEPFDADLTICSQSLPPHEKPKPESEIRLCQPCAKRAIK